MTDATEPEIDVKAERRALYDELKAHGAELDRKLLGKGRFRDNETDKTRKGWWDTRLSYFREKRHLLNDIEDAAGIDEELADLRDTVEDKLGAFAEA